MLALLLALALQTSTPDLGGEGPLRNATFLPTAAEASAEIARGDRAWASLQAGQGTAKARSEAFDAWREALLLSQPGDCVLLEALDEEVESLWPDPDHTHHRRSEGVAAAVLRRLHVLTEAERNAWRERFESLSISALAAAGTDRAQLARVERDLPLTSGAARAALRLADVAFEHGALVDANSWLARARTHTNSEGSLAQAVAARANAIATLAPRKSQDEAWRTASNLKDEGSLRIEGGPRFGRKSGDALGRGVEPGLVWMNDGRVVVQSARALLRLDTDGKAQRHELGRALPIDYPGSRFPGLLPYASASSGGWPMLPATDGRDLIMVVGRGRNDHGNAICCLRFDERGLPVPRWTRSDEGWLRAGEEEPQVEETRWNFQPGPLVHGGRVYVQAREIAAGAEASGERIWLCAFDLTDGALLWKRFLTKAADLRSDIGGRFGPRSGPSSPGQPLSVSSGGRIFVGTNVGLGTLVDAVDGRIVWNFRSRRRDPESPGWPGSRRASFGRSGEVYWAPFDSDFLYVLNASPDLGQGLLRTAPRPIGEGEDLLTADESQTLLLGRAGPRRTLTARDADWDRRDSLFLARGEAFRGAGLASQARVWVATGRGLYCFDRTRDLFLESVQRLADAGGGVGGAVYARGARIIVLGADTLWTFRVSK